MAWSPFSVSAHTESTETGRHFTLTRRAGCEQGSENKLTKQPLNITRRSRGTPSRARQAAALPFHGGPHRADTWVPPQPPPPPGTVTLPPKTTPARVGTDSPQTLLIARIMSSYTDGESRHTVTTRNPTSAALDPHGTSSRAFEK